MKCIVLRYPDGTIGTRGGFGPGALASYLTMLRTGNEREAFSITVSEQIIEAASRADIEAARDFGLDYILRFRVPVQNPDAVAEIVDADFPIDRLFRTAWEHTAGESVIRENMPKARGIQMDKIRAVRNAELAARDITFMRAVEAGDTSAQSTIATEKQTLRDIPQTFDLTTDTAEQLKAKWPSELPDRE